MEQSLSWEANGFSASQEIPRILWNPKVHYRVYMYPPPVLIMGQVSMVFWTSILILPSHLRLELPGYLFQSLFPKNITLYVSLLSPIRATCSAHLITPNSINRIAFCEQYRSLSSPICSFLYSLITSSLLGPNSLLRTLISNIFSLRSSLNVSDHVSHPCKTTKIAQHNTHHT